MYMYISFFLLIWRYEIPPIEAIWYILIDT